MHVWRISTLGLFCLIGAAPGCAKSDHKAPNAEQRAAHDPAPAQPAGRADQAPAADKAKEPTARKIIYTANVRLTVEDFAKTKQELEQLLDAHKGYVIQAAE